MRTYEELARELEQPIDLVLYCPKCGLQHIDRPDPEQELTGQSWDHTPEGLKPAPFTYVGRPAGAWTNPPHKSHLCRPDDGGCGHVWRPCDRPTNGVLRTVSGKDGDCDPRALILKGYQQHANISASAHVIFPPGTTGFTCGCPACVGKKKRPVKGVRAVQATR